MLWQLSLVTMFAVVFGLAGLRKNETYSGHTWTVFESVVYNCFHKTCWSLALGWIIFSVVVILGITLISLVAIYLSYFPATIVATKDLEKKN